MGLGDAVGNVLLAAGRGSCRLVAVCCGEEAGKRRELDDGVDVRLDMTVVGGCSGGCSRSGLLGFVHEKWWKWIGQNRF